MLVAQEIVDRLDGIEGAEGNLYEDGAPVAHSAVPKTWEFEGLEFLTGFRLGRYEASGLIDELRQVEGLSLVVLHGTDEIWSDTVPS